MPPSPPAAKAGPTSTPTLAELIARDDRGYAAAVGEEKRSRFQSAIRALESITKRR